MERSTVDFIVPGEMELTSAVRSVSCGSTINKCNGSVPPSAMASNSAASKALLPHNKVSSYLFTFVCLLFVFTHFFVYFFQDKDGCGSGNDGDDEEEYGLHKKNFYKNSMLGHGYMGPPPGSLQMPPSYRPPPPYGSGMPPTCNRQGGMSNPMLSLSSCPCCGEVQISRIFVFNFCYLAQC